MLIAQENEEDMLRMTDRGAPMDLSEEAEPEMEVLGEVMNSILS